MRILTPVILVLVSVSLLACGGGGGGGASPGSASKQQSSQSLDFTVNENSEIVFNNPAISDGSLEFAITGGEDRALFAFDSGAGNFKAKVAPDYEFPADADGDNEYLVEITITSSALILTQSLTIRVEDENDNPPVFSIGSLTPSIAENTTAVPTVSVTDADSVGTLSYNLSGVDSALFTIGDGSLSFIAAPDYEDPAHGNTYEVTVEVSDAVNAVVTQDITVTVNDANDIAPVLNVGAERDVEENTTRVTTVSASDVDTVGNLIFSLSGADSALFTISDGSLFFMAAPDYEEPTDSGSDNVYNVTVEVSDGVNTDSQAITVTVNNIPDTPVPAAPTLSLGIAPKLLQFSWNAVAGATFYRLYENLDGGSGFTQVGANIEGAMSSNLGISVHRHDWDNARYHLEACNSDHCSIPSSEVFTLDQMLKGIGYIKASTPGGDDQFGQSIALSDDGKTLAVGAWHEDSNAVTINGDETNDTATDAGAVYVYTQGSDGLWSQQAYIKASNAGGGDEFGRAIALSEDGDTLVVGAPKEDSASGAVYVFSRDVTVWTQQDYIKASNTGAGDEFGYSVSLSNDGNTLAVGAWREDSNSQIISTDTSVGGVDNDLATNAGAVYVFSRSDTSWTQQSYVKAPNAETTDWFGYSVSVSGDGNTLAVGATHEDSNATGTNSTPNGIDSTDYDSGAVYVYSRTEIAWTHQSYLKAANTDASDWFGESVSLSDNGNVLAVGSRLEDSAAMGIGSNAIDDCGEISPVNCADNSGAVYVFSRTDLNWTQQAYIKASNTDAGDEFGIAVALSGDGLNLIVGAYHEDSNALGINNSDIDNSVSESGASYLYQYVGSAWSGPVYIKAPNTDSPDVLGTSVAIDQDGSALAVGANGEGSNLTGVNTGDTLDNHDAPVSGAVYLY